MDQVCQHSIPTWPVEKAMVEKKSSSCRALCEGRVRAGRNVAGKRGRGEVYIFFAGGVRRDGENVFLLKTD